jgi:hypothetical protein
MINRASTADIANLALAKSNLTYKDLKKECIQRGMPFIDVLSGDFPRLTHWLLNNLHKTFNSDLLDEFDDFQEKILKENGKTELIHNSLRLGYLGERDDAEPVVKKDKVIKEKKAPREKTEGGLFKGTKKAYTFDLQIKGKKLEEVLIKVKRKFPDAVDKSIKIWFNKSRKLNATHK